MGVQRDWLMRLQAHALIVACLVVQYSSCVVPWWLLDGLCTCEEWAGVSAQT